MHIESTQRQSEPGTSPVQHGHSLAAYTFEGGASVQRTGATNREVDPNILKPADAPVSTSLQEKGNFESAVAQIRFLLSSTLRTALALPIALRVRKEFVVEPQSVEACSVKRLSLFGMLCKAEFGGIQADLAECKPNARRVVQQMSATALSIVSVVDHYIDETNMEFSKKVGLLESMKRTLRTGISESHQYQQLTRCSEICASLHTQSQKMPNGDIFINEFCRLADAAITQIRNPGTMQSAMEVGGVTGSLVAAIPQALSRRPDDRLMRAARLFGAHIQLLDDVQDFPHDQQRGLNTPITSALDPIRAAKNAYVLSMQLYKECLALLKIDEQDVYKSLAFFGNKRWGGRQSDAQMELALNRDKKFVESIAPAH